MKTMTKKIFSLLLAFTLVFGALPTNVFAAPTGEDTVNKTEKVESAETFESAEPIEVSMGSYGSFTLNSALSADEDVKVDMDEPAIAAFSSDLDNIKVLNAEGDSVPLTEGEKQQLLEMYAQYLGHWAENKHVLGAQTPFFLQYNDNEDDLGVLGEMLIMANIPLAAVRAGMVSFDDLSGMIMNFMFGDQFGVQFYGSKITAARDEALKAIKDSGAKTEEQKLLVLNDWLAHNVTFDMPYIMNSGKEVDERPMVAADPQQHPYYDEVFDAIYDVYYDQIEAQFHDEFYNAIKADLRAKFYQGAIEQGYYQGVYEAAYPDVYAAVEQGFYDNIYPQVLDGVKEAAYNSAYEEALAALKEDPANEGVSEEDLNAKAAEAATAAVEANLETLEAQADEATKAQLASDDIKPEIEAEAKKQTEAVAESETEKFMTENAEAIEADPAGFILATFGAEAAAQIETEADAFIASAETDGVEVQPGVVMTVEELTQQTMENEKTIDVDGDEVPDLTANQAIPVYAEQAAAGLTDGVLNYWEGSHIGALAEGTSVCLGYAKAFAYIVQFMHPEIYAKEGTTDLNNSANWKSNEELYYTDGALDITKNYAVDLVRIKFDASVTMYGETQENFNSDHFWNAVQIDGTWYYVDPCYTDVFTEVMSRDRVETDGNMNHLYFLFSHETAASLYEGNFSEIKSLYDGDGVTGKHYEDTWFSRAASNVYPDKAANPTFYYLYDSTDLISMLEEYNNSSSVSDMAGLNTEGVYKLVGHPLTTSDKNSDGDTDYTAYIEFNYKENEDDETSVARFLNADGEMEESEILTKLYAKHRAESEVYPSIAITTALYNGKLYFNLSNCILAYDLSTNTVGLVKEYTTVSAKRDDTKPFGGMAFSVCEEGEGDFTVENHPIAGMTIKDDGKMYVSVATNFAFISGKDPYNLADTSSYGYEFEESNFNPAYSTYGMEDYDDSMLESFGYEKEVNDNDEFMWTANFVETMNASSLEVAELDTYVGFECGHHYLRFDETYYTKDENGNWNHGFCYVCTVCGHAVEEPTEPDPNANYEMYDTTYEEQLAIYEEEKAIYDAAAASAGHTYTAVDPKWSNENTLVTFDEIICSSVCKERQDTLDCLLEDNDIEASLAEAVSLEATVTGFEGVCTEGGIATHTATGEVEATNTADKTGTYKVTVVTTSEVEPGEHAYNGEFTWEEVVDEEGNPTGETKITADVTCPTCGDAHEDVPATEELDESAHVDPTCTEKGKDVYVVTATVVVVDEETEKETVIGKATTTREEEIPANGHDYVDGFCSVCGEEEPDIEAPFMEYVYSKLQTSARAQWTAVEDAEGYELYRATAIDAADEEWALTKTINDGTKTTYTNQQLEKGTTYYYKVRAFRTNSAGERVYSEFSNIEYMPAAVVFEKVYSNSTSRVRIMWYEISGADGYQIWRKNLADGEDAEWKIVKTLGDRENTLTNDQGATTAYSNTGLEAGATYVYKMRAFAIPEEGRKVFGAYSDEYTVSVIPETPSITVTSPKAGRAEIKWDAIDGAAGYQVWMSETEDGTYSIVKSVTDTATTSYTKYELTSGKTYYFKVRTYSEAEGRKAFSAFSDVKSITVK